MGSFAKSAKELDRDGWRQLMAWSGRAGSSAIYGNGFDMEDIKKTPIPPAPLYPPMREVQETWERLRPLSSAPLPDGGVQEEETWRWLQLRRVDAGMVGALDLARVQIGGALPGWVPRWPWGLAMPLADCTGLVRSLRWRAPRGAKAGGEDLLIRLRREAAWEGVGAGAGVEAGPGAEARARARALLADPVVTRVLGAAPGPKSRTPTGFEAAGLVLADPMGRALLGRGAGGRVSMRAQDGEEVGWDGRVLLVEGDVDWLTWSAHPRRVRGGQTWAVLGYTSGAWSRAHAERLPEDCTVIIRHQGDRAGLAYERHIRDTLPLAIRLQVLQVGGADAGSGGTDAGQG